MPDQAPDADGRAPVDLDGLLQEHLPALRAYVRHRADRLVSRKESVSDLVQSVCREVIEHVDRFEHQSPEGFRQWLFRTAERKIIDRYRYYTADKRDAGREIDEGTPTPPPALFQTPSRDAIAREDLAAAEAAFALLPDATQQVIMLSRVQGLSHAEIAQRLQRSEGAVRNLLYRGLAAISDALRSPADGRDGEGDSGAAADAAAPPDAAAAPSPGAAARAPAPPRPPAATA